MSARTPQPLPPHSPACLPMLARSWRDGGPRYICVNTCPRRLALNGEPLKRAHDDPAQLRLPGTEPYYGR
jgi:hypothetical protein